jgi:hypothetical protein
MEAPCIPPRKLPVGTSQLHFMMYWASIVYINLEEYATKESGRQLYMPGNARVCAIQNEQAADGNQGIA